MASSRLRRSWDVYVKASSDTDFIQKKSSKFDSFLKLYIYETQSQENLDGALQFSDMKSVSNLLAGEFLVDIHKVCSAGSTESDEDVTELRNYLLNGRGWMILRSINVTGVQGLSCSRELADLLVSLLAFCCQFPLVQPSFSDDTLEDLPPIEHSFQPHLLRSGKRLKQTVSLPEDYDEAEGSLHIRSSGGSNPSTEDMESSDSQSDSDSAPPQMALNSPFHRSSADVNVSQLFYRQISSADEEMELPCDENDALFNEKSSMQVGILILTLLEKLCKADYGKAGLSNSIAMSVLPSLLQILVGFHSDDFCSPDGWMERDITHIQRCILRVITGAAGMIICHQNGVAMLGASGLISALADITRSCYHEIREHSVTDGACYHDIIHRLYMMVDFVQGMVLTLNYVFQNLPTNPSFLNNALKLLGEFYRKDGLQLVEDLVFLLEETQMDGSLSSDEVESFKEYLTHTISYTGSVIGALKKSKVDYIHAVQCGKRKHKRCEYRRYLHHHHDILALSLFTPQDHYLNLTRNKFPGKNGEDAGQQECAIKILAEFLLKLFQNAESRLTKLGVLRCLEKIGICCCLVPQRVIQSLMQKFVSESACMRNYILSVLCNVLLDQCGGAQSVQDRLASSACICTVCNDSSLLKDKFFEMNLPLDLYERGPTRTMSENSDSALSNSESSLHEVSSLHSPRWRSLKEFLPFILYKDELVSVQVIRHLLRLVGQGSYHLKQELFYEIFLPTLQGAKENLCKIFGSSKDFNFSESPVKESESSPPANADEANHRTSPSMVPHCSVVKYCLSALPQLLQTKPSQHLFLNQGGVDQLCQLLYNRIFQKSVIKAFEVLIITEEHKKQIPRQQTVLRNCVSYPLLHSNARTARKHGNQRSSSTDESDNIQSDVDDSDADLLMARISVIETFMGFLFSVQSKELQIPQNETHISSDSSFRLETRSEHRESVTKETEFTSEEHKKDETETPNLDSENGASHKIPTKPCILSLFTNLWDSCETLLSHSMSFRISFLAHNGFHLAYELLKEAIKVLGKSISSVSGTEFNLKRMSGWSDSIMEAHKNHLLLVQSLLSICLHCCDNSRQVVPQPMGTESLLTTVQSLLIENIAVSDDICYRNVCDVLLNVAVVHKNIKDVLHNHTFAVMHLKADECIDEEDLLYLSDSCSTSDNPHTDLGYVADTECVSDCMDKDTTTQGKEECEFASLIPVQAINHVTYPKVCIMLLKLLSTHLKSGHKLPNCLSHVLYQMIFLCQQSKHNLSAFYQENMVSELLNNFCENFLSEGPTNEVEQMLLLDLLLVLTQKQISSSELKLFLKMFQKKDVPQETLLSSLITLIENFKPCPLHYLTFPVVYPNHTDERNDLEVTVRSVDSDILSASIRPSTNITSHLSGDVEYNSLIKMGGVQEAIEFQSYHSMDSMSDDTVKSTFSPMCLPIRSNFTWPVSRSGFSVSLWLHVKMTTERNNGVVSHRLKRNGHSFAGLRGCASSESIAPMKCMSLGMKAALNRSNSGRRAWNHSCVHVLSVHARPLCFQVWTDPAKANLVFRIVKIVSDTEEVLDETFIPSVLRSSRWQHLTLTVREKAATSRTISKISVVVDGFISHEVVLEYHSPTCNADTVSEPFLLLGHMVPAVTAARIHGNVKISSVMLFKDSVLNKENSFHITCMGPNRVDLSKCDAVNKNILYSQHLTHDLLSQSNLSYDVLTGKEQMSLNMMRENLVLTYIPDSEKPTRFNLYGQTSPFKENLKAGLSGLSFRKKDVAFNPLTQMPKQIQLNCSPLVDITSEHCHDFDKIIDEIGGIGAFLCLYAKIVERESNEKEQSMALRVLIILLKQSPHHRTAFENLSGYSMLVKVMTSSKCILGFQALHVLLDACLSRPALRYDSWTKTYSLNKDSNAVIQDTNLITHILLEWRVWERSDVSVWKMALQAVELMISDQHPHQEFNMKQLHNIHMVDRLLLMCLERAQEGYPSLPAAICESVVELTKCMMGYPPDSNLMMTVCDFLLLMHPAASTFVCHLPAGFYFTHKWAGSSSPLLKKRSRARFRSKTSNKASVGRRSDTVTVISKVLNEVRDNLEEGKLKRSVSCPPDELVPFFIETSDSECILESSTEAQPGTTEYPALTVENKLDIEEDIENEMDSVQCKTDDSETVVVTVEEESSFTDNNNQSNGQTLPVVNTSTNVEENQQVKGILDSNNANTKEIACEDTLTGLTLFPRSSSGAELTSKLSDSHPKMVSRILEGLSSNSQEKHCIKLSNSAPNLKTDCFAQTHDTVDLDCNFLTVPTSHKKAHSLPSEFSMKIEECDNWMCRDENGNSQSALLKSVQASDSGNPAFPVKNVSSHDLIANENLAEQNITEGSTDEKDPLEIDTDQFTNRVKKSALSPLKNNHMSPSSHSTGSDWELITDAVSLKSVPIKISHSSEVEAEQDLDNSNVQVCVGLLELIAHCLVLLPDNSLSVVMGTIVRPEILLVMVHHKELSIRTAVVKLLDVYFHRATSDQIENFMRIKGFHLLANQLHQHPASAELLEACFTIMFGQPHKLDMDFSASLLQEMSVVQQMSAVPVLALLENCVHDVAMCHNALCLLVQVFEMLPKMPQVMIENGLVETLCNVMHVVNVPAAVGEDSVSEEESRQTLIEDVQHFFRLVAERCFESSGAQHYQTFEDLMTTLQKLEHTEKQIHGLNSEAVENVRNIQLHALESVIENIHTRFLSTPGDNSFLQRSLSFKSGGKNSTSQGELLERYKKILVMAVDMVLLSDALQPPTTAAKRRLQRLVGEYIEVVPYQTEFQRSLLEVIVGDIVAGMERSFFRNNKSALESFMWQCKDTLRIQFSRLVPFMLSSRVPLSDRLFTIELLTSEAKCKDILKSALSIGSSGQRASSCVYELLVSPGQSIPQPVLDCGQHLLDLLRQCGFSTIRSNTKLTKDIMYSIQEEKRIWELEWKKEKQIWNRKKEMSLQRILNKMDIFSKRISDNGMEVTQIVVNMQNYERKKFIEHIKLMMTNNVHIKKAWQSLIQQLTHERAVWYCPESHPHSWQLDPTEGPFRVRRRLMPCHLGIKPKYLLPEHHQKLEPEGNKPPLSYLFEEESQNSDSAALIYRLHTNEKIRLTERCCNVTPFSEASGELLLGENSVYFVGDEAISDASHTQALLDSKDVCSMTLPHEDIKEVHCRWYQLKDNALEIFLTNGKTCLLSFESSKERDLVYQHLSHADLPSLIRSENLLAIQQLWLEGRITNFEYLTQLNKIAGRSFNDLMQYPVFPFILNQYTESTLNLNDLQSYRDLSKPISVQSKSRERKYLENYTWLEQEKARAEWMHATNSDIPESSEYQAEPYHYGSHYSNSGTVLHFLVRLPPFTKMFLSYQDNNFDLPDRTFHSINTAWRLASYESTTDVKELIPEFFFLPEFLCNDEGYDFGVRQAGQRVNHVHLPPWCHDDPRLFILIHRQALESAYVTQHLHHWVDLVFGFKQKGRPAIEAINVFHPATYFGINVDSIKDPVRRQALLTMIQTYGQTPKQLFRSPHLSAAVQPMNPSATNANKGFIKKRQVLDGVKGLRWGNYIGSPDCPEPVLAWTKAHKADVASLVALPTGEVFGLGPKSCLLVMYSKEKGVTVVNTVDVLWAGIVSWGHSDSVIRIKNRKDQPPVNFVHWDGRDQVTCCASVPDCRLLFFGGSSGVITVYNTKFSQDKLSDMAVYGKQWHMYGHSSAVTALHVCRAYSVLVSASQDGTCIIWDLNRLCYIRSITDYKRPVSCICVSETLGDIASVTHNSVGSTLMLHTINAVFIKSVECHERIHCLAYSSAPEGRAVNIIAGGLETGVIRLWSSWDLTEVRDIIVDSVPKPIVSITFTHDGQRLYSANAEGTVFMFTKSSQTKQKINNNYFIPFL